MSSFKDMLQDVLSEKRLTIKDLENAKILGEKYFYRYDEQYPYLKTAIRIANFLKVSLDYIVGISTVNHYKKYSEEQNFYKNICNFLKLANITKLKFVNDLNFTESIFSRWKRGSQPTLQTLINIVKYLGCSIDDLMDFE